VIDDEEAARYGIVRALLPQGYLLEEASDGHAAISKIQEFHPDVIVSDINMPGIDGLTLLRQLNASPDAPLVVLITAHGSEDVVVQALRLGAYNYLAKPFEISELRVIVRNAVEQQRLLRENRGYVEQLQKTVAELRESQAALVQAEKLASLGRLVAGMAHELNNPVGVLRTTSETVRSAVAKIAASMETESRVETASSRRILEALNSAATQGLAALERITALVKNLKEFAQLDRAEFQQFHIQGGIEATLKLLEHRFEGRVRVEKDLGDLPEIDCSPRQLNHVFMNLLLHAQAAIEKAGREGVIRLRTRYEDGRVELAVEHNGQEIAPEDVHRTFDPAFVARDGRISADLGLLICQQIIRSHDGTINVDSEPGLTRFVVTLPVTRPA
jgi:signal transduction histidine kinase